MAAGAGTGGAGVILRFERVRPRRAGVPAAQGAAKSRREFLDRTIRALKRWKYDIVGMDEVCRRAVTLPAERRFVCLTFDGGYKDLITSAYPVLARHGVPFTVYVPTAFPDGLGEAWWLALEQVIARESRISLVIDRREQRFNIGSVAEKYQLYAFLEDWMRSLTPPDLSAAINDLCTRYSVDLAALSREALMDWDDLAKLAADPNVTIGKRDRELSGPVEPEGCRRLARNDDGQGGGARPRCTADVRHFAYPFGDRGAFRRQHVVMAEEAGFASAVSAISGIVEADGRHQPARAAAHRLGRPAAFAARHARAVVRRHLRSGHAHRAAAIRPSGRNHPADDRHRRQHPADAGHDIERSPAAGRNWQATASAPPSFPVSDHTTTSTSSAMVPSNLRVRIVMTEMWVLRSGARLARGKGRTIRGARIHSSTAS